MLAPEDSQVIKSGSTTSQYVSNGKHTNSIELDSCHCISFCELLRETVKHTSSICLFLCSEKH